MEKDWKQKRRGGREDAGGTLWRGEGRGEGRQRSWQRGGQGPKVPWGGGQRQTMLVGGGGGGRATEAEPSLSWTEEILRKPAPGPLLVMGEQELKGTRRGGGHDWVCVVRTPVSSALE